MTMLTLQYVLFYGAAVAPQAAALATHLLPSTTQERFFLALWLKTSAEIKHHHPWCVPELKEARGEIIRWSQTEHRSAICGKRARLMARKEFPEDNRNRFYLFFWNIIQKSLFFRHFTKHLFAVLIGGKKPSTAFMSILSMKLEQAGLV